MFRYLLIILCALLSYSVYSQQELLPVFKNGKWAAVDTNLNLVTNYQYSNLFIVKDKFICAKKKGYFGLLNKKNSLVLPFEYEQIKDAVGEYLIVQKNGYWGIKNVEGKTIIDCNYKNINIPIPGFAILDIDEGKCFYDLTDRNRSSAYDKIEMQSNELILLEKDSEKGLYHITRKKISKEFILVEKKMDDLFFCVSKEGEKFVVTTNGGFSYLKTNQLRFFTINQSNFAYTVNDSLMIIDGNGVLKKKLKATSIKNLYNSYTRNSIGSYFPKESYFVFETDGKKGILESNYNELITAEYDDIRLNDSIFFVYKEGRVGMIRKNGEIILPPNFHYFRAEGNYWLVRNANKWGAVLQGGKKVVDLQYNSIRLVFGDKFVVGKDGKTGVIDDNENIILPFDKQYITEASKCFIIEKDALFGLAAINGQILFSPKYKKLKELSPDYFTFSEEKKSGIISSSGRIIIKAQFRNIFATGHEKIFFTQSFNYGYASLEDMKRDFNLDIRVPKNDIRKKHYRVGMINIYGQKLLEPEYYNEQIYTDIQGNTIIVKKEESVLVVTLDENGRLEDKTSYKNYVFVKSSSAPLEKNYWKKGKKSQYFHYGLFTPRGRTIIDYSYDDIFRNFLNNPDLVRTTSPYDRYGIVNERTGKIILNDVYKVIYTSDLQKGNAIRCLKSSGRGTIIDSSANVLIKGIAYVDDFENTYARVNIGGVLAYDDDFAHKLYVNQEKTMFPKRKEWQEGRDVVCHGGKWGVIDTDGNWMIKPKYQFLQSYANGVFIAKKDMEWGVITPKNELVIDFIYDELRYFSEIKDGDWAAIPFFKARVGSKWGVIDKHGKNIVPIEYSDVDFLISKGKVFFKTLIDYKKVLWGLVNKNGELVLDSKYEYISEFKNNIARVKMTRRKWKFLDLQMHEFPVGDFFEVKNFSEGLAAVKGIRGWGFLDEQGQLVIPCQYSDAGSFNQGLAKVKMYFPSRLFGLLKSKRVYVLIDKKGKIVYNTKSKYCSDVSNGQVVVKRGRKYRLIDVKGRKILPGSYNEIVQNINYGLYVVKNKKREYAVYNDKAELIVPFGKYQTFGSFSEGLCFVAGKEDEGYINVSGELKIPIECKDAQEFSEGLAAVKLQKGWVYINKAGDVVIEGNYTHAWPFENGMAKVRDKDYRVYFIDKNWQRINPDLAGSSNEKYQIITNNGFKGIENDKGDVVVYPAAKKIDLFKKDFAPVGIQKQYGLYSSDGEEITPPKYMIIRLNKTDNIEMINMEEVRFLK